MSKIRVKNFGPIKEGFNENDGFLDIKKVTVFIGNQGTGKSTVAKLISTCKWLEKAFNRGDINKERLSIGSFQSHCNYQGLKNYFIEKCTELGYEGNALQIEYDEHKGNPIAFSISNGKYLVPKLMYVPAERNFLSVVDNAFDVKGLPYPLLTFAEEFRKAQSESEAEVSLPINGYNYKYDEAEDKSYIIGDGHSVNMLEASSGLQSAVPLYLVSRNLSLLIDITEGFQIENLSANQLIRRNNEIATAAIDNKLSDEERRNRIEKIRKKYRNTSFINIVEEPEQNLFPDSQRHILNSLLDFANRQEANELLMTTHSPYIINYLSIAIQGKHLLDKIDASPNKDKLLPRLNAIVPIEACVAADDVAVYQFQNDGSICRLGSYEGIPSDKNYLNQSLAEGNHLFDALLELEEEL